FSPLPSGSDAIQFEPDVDEKDVLLVLSSGYPRFPGDILGGAPFVHELAKRMVGNFEVHVLTPYCRGSSTTEVMDGVSVRRYRYLPPGVADLTGEGGIADNLKSSAFNFLKVPPLVFLMLLILLRDLIRFRKRRVVIHAHWIIPQGIVAIIAKSCLPWKVRVLSTAHGSDVMAFSSGIIAPIQRFILRQSDAVTVVSGALAANLRSRFEIENAVVAPMGIDTSLFHPARATSEIKFRLSPQGPMVLFVGFLVEVKGVDVLLEAFAKVVAVHPAAKLIIVGDGQERAPLEAFARRLGIGDKVEFLGALPQVEIAPLFASADVFVAPSRREGFGLVFAEAMSAGALVVAPDIPPLNDLIKHEVSGYLVKPACPQSFAERVIQILNSPQNSDAIRGAARLEIVEQLGWDKVSKNYAQIFQNLVSSRSTDG
ncbi:MAG: glycosyltransferase family 4 protein, partial [Bacteroidetes bacterium]|nr:glycosyltransferase family 4 protein [Bacteroidota bacterium]